ncbi:MAG: AAA family ATPase [Caldilineaceae bacterium]|nr:AAA family ATPase [Caldilineaceae bacterium]
MRIRQLHLQNIGPFIEAELAFFTPSEEKPRVTLITGENGTGKSIILDAIRGMFGSRYGNLERDIQRRGAEEKARIDIELNVEKSNLQLSSANFSQREINIQQSPPPQQTAESIQEIPFLIQRGDKPPKWIVDYWPSVLAQGSYQIQALNAPKHKDFLLNSLSGQKQKADIVELICHFDYLRDSRDEAERITGHHLYSVLEKIIESSLLDGGKFSHVARSTYEPIVIQNGMEVTLPQLSSGNSYLIQDMVDLLGKMYSLQFLRNDPIEELCQAPGLLLIDEAENQLHPKWQKRFISTILDIFPNLQIIATTHSPFIISSVENPRLYVCKSRHDRCVIEDVSAEYSNKPVDEILMSPLFEETQPFNQEITRLIARRKEAIEKEDHAQREQIEKRLKALNPEYFSYLDLDELIAEMTAESM